MRPERSRFLEEHAHKHDILVTEEIKNVLVTQNVTGH